MADKLWKGGTTAVALVRTFTLANFANDETNADIVMTAEDGTTLQTVATTPSGVDETVIAAAMQANLAASSETLFTAVTWTVASNVVTGTAKVAGTPFVAASAATGGTGTITDATGTASAGQSDWGTAANFDGSGVPSADTVRLAPDSEGDSYPVLFGLNQSAVTLTGINVGAAFTGGIGQNANSYYLHVNGTTAILHSNGPGIWLQGDWTNVYYPEGKSGPNALQLKDGGTAITNLYIVGPSAQGTVTLPDSHTLTNLYVTGAFGVTVNIGTNGTKMDLVEVDSGNILIERQVDALHNAGATVTHEGTNNVLTLEHWSGTTFMNGSGTYGGTKIAVRGGIATLQNNKSTTVTIGTSVDLRGGTWNEKSGLGNVTYSGTPDIDKHGGEVIPDTNSNLTLA